MNIVITFDPGDTTGYAVGDLDKIVDNMPKILEAGVLMEWKSIAELLARVGPKTVVFEEFRLYPKQAASLPFDQLFPVQVIGAIKYIAEALRIPYIGQTAAFGKKQQIPKAVRTTYMNKHTRDALCHLKGYALSCGLVHP